MTAPTPYLDQLQSLVQPKGAWGYAPDQRAHLEPTCLGLLALNLEPEQRTELRQLAQEFLLQALRPDGTFRLEGDREDATWPTALALFTLQSINPQAAPIEQAANRLLGRGAPVVVVPATRYSTPEIDGRAIEPG